MDSPIAPSFQEIILQQRPLLDVRAPVEFTQGHVPGAVNLPLIDDEQRKEIGTLYKEQGSEAAVARGHQLISGSLKESRIQQWVEFVKKNPTAVMTCFRGGLRSQISQQWLAEAGFPVPRLAGGYKAFRQFLLETLEGLGKRPLLVVSGATGAGKTLVLRQVEKWRATVDLEKYANHRGSAFGGYQEGQPTQTQFENRLAVAMLHLQSQNSLQPWVVEDESRMIGRCAQPEIFFNSLRQSPVVMIEEPLESRVQVTFEDYIVKAPLSWQHFDRYQEALRKISRKLGGLRYQEVLGDLQTARQKFKDHQELESNKVWIEKLLVWYYDPLYFRSLHKRQPHFLFQGSRQDVLDFLKS